MRQQRLAKVSSRCLSESDTPWEQGGTTDYKYPHGEIATVQQPECPAPEPPVPFFESQRDNILIKNIAQDRAVISSLYDTRQSDGKLEVIQVTKAYIHSIFQATTKDEERGRVF
jgi:hypothetical protein